MSQFHWTQFYFRGWGFQKQAGGLCHSFQTKCLVHPVTLAVLDVPSHPCHCPASDVCVLSAVCLLTLIQTAQTMSMMESSPLATETMTSILHHHC